LTVGGYVVRRRVWTPEGLSARFVFRDTSYVRPVVRTELGSSRLSIAYGSRAPSRDHVHHAASIAAPTLIARFLDRGLGSALAAIVASGSRRVWWLGHLAGGGTVPGEEEEAIRLLRWEPPRTRILLSTFAIWGAVRGPARGPTKKGARQWRATRRSRRSRVGSDRTHPCNVLGRFSSYPHFAVQHVEKSSRSSAYESLAEGTRRRTTEQSPRAPRCIARHGAAQFRGR